MDDITDIESRLRSALGRIETRLADEDGGGEAARLRADLSAERDANAQLTERYELVRRRHAARLKVLESEIEEAETRADVAEAQAARLLAANERLRAAAEKVREAASADGALAGEVDALLREEIAALNEAREADRASLDALLEELAPFAIGANSSDGESGGAAEPEAEDEPGDMGEEPEEAGAPDEPDEGAPDDDADDEPEENAP